MQKLLTTLLILFAFNVSLSQGKIIIGSVKRGPFLISELSYVKGDSLNKYTWMLHDATSDILKSVELVCTEKNIKDLYIFFKTKISAANGSTDEMSLSGIKVNATTQKMIGLKNILVTVNESYQIGLNQNEIEKLFSGLVTGK